ncbi:hypothetical protein CDAR_48741 [Caerostris darwini]|uniref:Uncharacterized protein n=1 Tax=Caerostris darwini TaxID=1538125 RepID=A0AAV4NKL7_9ARAC|nr:hypothetical protein CDAR_48741 [Caerostris darwini]
MRWRGRQRHLNQLLELFRNLNIGVGKEGRDCRWGRDCISPVGLFQAVLQDSGSSRNGQQAVRGLLSGWSICLDIYEVPPTSPGDRSFADDIILYVPREGARGGKGDETSKFLADNTSLEGVNDEHFLRIFRQQHCYCPRPLTRFFDFLPGRFGD